VVSSKSAVLDHAIAVLRRGESLTLDAVKGSLEHPALYVVVAVGYLGAFGLLAVVLRTGMSSRISYGIWEQTASH
jgi:multidrug transporter EmrE-like cation transporter